VKGRGSRRRTGKAKQKENIILFDKLIGFDLLETHAACCLLRPIHSQATFHPCTHKLCPIAESHSMDERGLQFRTGMCAVVVLVFVLSWCFLLLTLLLLLRLLLPLFSSFSLLLFVIAAAVVPPLVVCGANAAQLSDVAAVSSC
jgi:hypothetical protein